MHSPGEPPFQNQRVTLPEIFIAETGAMREGARDQLDRMMRQNLPELLAFAVRLTGSHDQAEELVQEAMLRAIRNWSGFRGESNPKTWLFSIAINVFRDDLRSKSNQQEQLDQDVTILEGGPEQQTMATELSEEIANQISKLPTRQREVLVLTTYEGMSVKETGEILNMKPSNVYTTLHHARNTLKEKLNPFLDPDPKQQ